MVLTQKYFHGFLIGKEGELLYPISAEDYLSNWKGRLMTEPSISAGDNYLLVRLKIRS